MATRTVRLDRGSERVLADVRSATGLSVSEILKRGIAEVKRTLQNQVAERPFDLYVTLDLGPGGYALAPARQAKTALRRILRAKAQKSRR